MRRIVISDAAGFLGSHLVDHFIAQGDVVYGLDNYCTGRLENLETHKDNPSFLPMHCDVSARVPYFQAEVARKALI